MSEKNIQELQNRISNLISRAKPLGCSVDSLLELQSMDLSSFGENDLKKVMKQLSILEKQYAKAESAKVRKEQEDKAFFGEILAVIAKAKALGLTRIDYDKSPLREDELKAWRKLFMESKAFSTHQEERRNFDRVCQELWDFHQYREIIQIRRDQLKNIPAVLEYWEREYNLLRSQEEWEEANEALNIMKFLSLKRQEYEKDVQELTEVIQKEAARLENKSSLHSLEKEFIDKHPNTPINVRRIIPGIQRQEEDINSGIHSLVQQASNGDQKSLEDVLNLGILTKPQAEKKGVDWNRLTHVLSENGWAHTIKEKEIIFKINLDTKKEQERLAAAFPKGFNNVKYLLQNSQIVAGPANIIHNQRLKKERTLQEVKSEARIALIELILKGIISKSEIRKCISKSKGSREKILTDLVEKGIVSDYSEKKILVLSNLSAKIDQVRKIAGKDFNQVWELLQKRPAWEDCKFANIIGYFKWMVQRALGDYVKEIYTQRYYEKNLGDASEDLGDKVQDGVNEDAPKNEKAEGKIEDNLDDDKANAKAQQNEYKRFQQSYESTVHEQHNQYDKKLDYRTLKKVVKQGGMTQSQFEEVGLDWNDVVEKLVKNEWAEINTITELILKPDWQFELEEMMDVFKNDFSKLLDILEQVEIDIMPIQIAARRVGVSEQTLRNYENNDDGSFKPRWRVWRKRKPDSFTQKPTTVENRMRYYLETDITELIKIRDDKVKNRRHEKEQPRIALVEILLQALEIKSGSIYNSELKKKALAKQMYRLKDEIPKPELNDRGEIVWSAEQKIEIAKKLGIDLPISISKEFTMMDFQDDFDCLKETIGLIMRVLDKPTPQFESSESGLKWINESIEPYQLVRTEYDILDLDNQAQNLIRKIVNDYKVNSFFELTIENLMELLRTKEGKDLRNKIVLAFMNRDEIPPEEKILADESDD